MDHLTKYKGQDFGTYRDSDEEDWDVFTRARWETVGLPLAWSGKRNTGQNLKRQHYHRRLPAGLPLPSPGERANALILTCP